MTVGMAAALSLCHSDLSLCHSGQAPCYSSLFLCHSKLPFYHSELSSDHPELSSDHPEPSSGHFTPFPCHSERSEESFPTPQQKGQGNIPMAPIRCHSTCGIDLTLVRNSGSGNQHGNAPRRKLPPGDINQYRKLKSPVVTVPVGEHFKEMILFPEEIPVWDAVYVY